MNAPSISVVVPTYNRADLIGATLDAILAQDFPASEVIVVDDGSTDATRDVLSGYEARVQTIRISNSGDLAARNVGLRAASGRLVAFCDSDDIWRRGFLTAMARLWRHAPRLMASYGNFQIVRENAWCERTKFSMAPPGFWAGLRSLGEGAAVFDYPVVERLLAFQPFFVSAMVVNRVTFLEDGGWDEAVGRIAAGDFATALRVAEGPLGILHSSLVGIRKHGKNFSSDVLTTNLGEALVLEHVLETRRALEPHREAVLMSIADRRAGAADAAFDRREFASVRDIYAMLPPSHRPLIRRSKYWMSCLPTPIARHVAAIGSLARAIIPGRGGRGLKWPAKLRPAP